MCSGCIVINEWYAVYIVVLMSCFCLMAVSAGLGYGSAPVLPATLPVNLTPVKYGILYAVN